MKLHEIVRLSEEKQIEELKKIGKYKECGCKKTKKQIIEDVVSSPEPLKQ